MTTTAAMRDALIAAPRPEKFVTDGDVDLIAYADWFFKVRGPALTAPPDHPASVDMGLVEALTKRWKVCRDASVDGDIPLREQIVFSGRAGGLKEAIDLIAPASRASAQPPKCFECGTDLSAPICIKCNPEIFAPESVAPDAAGEDLAQVIYRLSPFMTMTSGAGTMPAVNMAFAGDGALAKSQELHAAITDAMRRPNPRRRRIERERSNICRSGHQSQS